MASGKVAPEPQGSHTDVEAANVGGMQQDADKVAKMHELIARLDDDIWIKISVAMLEEHGPDKCSAEVKTKYAQGSTDHACTCSSTVSTLESADPNAAAAPF